jgi:tape measure domain-containing protein
MPQLDAKLSIQPQFERALAALKELAAAVDAVKGKTQAPGAATTGPVATTAKQAAKATTEVKQLGDELKKTQAVASAPAAGQSAFKPMRDGIRSISTQLAEARTQLLAFLGAQVGIGTLRQLATLSDGYVGMTARLRIATRGQDEFNTALGTAKLLANQYVQPLAETGALYARMLSALRPLGGGTREATVATEALLASLRITGATASESGSAILQFSQAMSSGALRGEEFNAIAEAAPRLLDALAAGLGKPRDQLRALAEQGKLTTAEVTRALAKELPKLRAEAASIPDTIGSSVTYANNKLFKLVGASSEGSQGLRLITSAIRALADNLEPLLTGLTALVVLFGALKLRAFAVGIAAAGAALTKTAMMATGFGVALRFALGIITGPLGWIVTLGLAAAAWLKLGEAKKKATERTEDVVRSELADAERELALARKDEKDAGVFVSPQARGETQQADARVRRLQEELDLIRQVQGAAQNDAIQARRGAAALDLDSPRVIAEFKKQYETRAAIVRRFSDERVQFEAAANREIQRLRGAGGTAEAIAQLERERDDALALQARERNQALAQFDREGQTTRVAQARVAFDAQLALAQDAIEREQAANQAAYDDKLKSLQDYLAERERLEKAGVDRRLQKIFAELSAEQDALAKNKARLGRAGNPNERETLQDAVAKSTARIAELEVEIDKALRDGNTAAAERLRLVRNIARELQQQREQISFALEDASGQDLDREALRRRAEAANRAVLEAFRQAGDKEGERLTLRLIDVQTDQAALAQLQRAFERVQREVSSRENALQAKAAANAITTEQAESEILALRREQLPVLDGLLARMEAMARTPEDRAFIQGKRAEIQVMRDLRSETERTLRGSAIDGLANTINSLVTGAKTLGQALRDAVLGFAQAMLQVLQRRLAEALVTQFETAFKSSTGSGFFATAANFIAKLFHSGGVVGQGGQRRTVPLAAFALAPRYHAGGIAGLKPREVPAVLEAGEEVLTTDDPRHVRNGGRGGGPVVGAVNISVTVDSGGEAGSAQISAVLGRVLSAKVAEAIQEQLRPGGVLATR